MTRIIDRANRPLGGGPRQSLLGQVIALNTLLVVSVVLIAAVAASLDLDITGERWQFLLLVVAIAVILFGNIFVLRRRFEPLERLLDRVESSEDSEAGDEGSADAAAAAMGDGPAADYTDEVVRLTSSFNKALRKVEARRRTGAARLLEVGDAERKRISRELRRVSDGALAAARVDLERIDAGDLSTEDRIRTDAAVAWLSSAIEDMSHLSKDLDPPLLEELALAPAIAAALGDFKERAGVETSFRSAGDVESIESGPQIATYRVLRESLSNVAKHADANLVTVSLSAAHGMLTLVVRDDGRGFDDGSRRANGCPGIEGLKVMAGAIGGSVEVVSRAGNGTALTFRAPMRVSSNGRAATRR